MDASADTPESSRTYNLITKILYFVGTLILASIFDLLVAHFTLPKGEIYTGSVVSIEDQRYMPLFIENRSATVIDDLRIIVPSSFDSRNYIASSPLEVKATPLSDERSEETIVSLSNLEPRSRSWLVLTFPKSTRLDSVRFLNARELHLEVFGPSNLESRTFLAVRAVIRNALIYGVLLSLSFFLVSVQLKKTIAEERELVSEVKEQGETLKGQSLELSRKLEESATEVLRLKVTSLRKLTDARAELDFWKDTIRKVIYDSSSESDGFLERVFRAVTESLRSYSILGKADVDREKLESLESELRERSQ